MSDIHIWEDLPKSQVDPETIDEAIAAGIEVHNDDSEAHMAALSSLAAHRDNAVIDHPAESVPNDKLVPRARANVAIVDPGSDYDFDTLAAAIAYVDSVGGGNILIAPGTHYITGLTTLPKDVNLIGVDPDVCIIVTGTTSVDLIEFDWTTDTGNYSQLIEKITFENGGNGVFTGDGVGYSGSDLTYIRDCKFLGNYTHFVRTPRECVFERCYFDFGTNAAIMVGNTIKFYECEAQANAGGVGCQFTSLDVIEDGEQFITLYDTTIVGRSGVQNVLFDEYVLSEISLFRCNIQFWDPRGLEFPIQDLVDNYIQLTTAAYFLLDSGGCYFSHNTIVGGSGNQIRTSGGANPSIFVFNSISTPITDPDKSSLNRFNGETQYFTHANSATAMGLLFINMAQLTPNSTRTLTTTVPPAGIERIIKILTSGTTSYTLTFGSGFKPSATLATGTVSNRVFIIRFVSDGTNLYEASRTTALVA